VLAVYESSKQVYALMWPLFSTLRNQESLRPGEVRHHFGRSVVDACSATSASAGRSQSLSVFCTGYGQGLLTYRNSPPSGHL